MIIHPIDPIYDNQSRILILGSFPSVKSREEGFCYGHPQNRFWRLLATICQEDTPVTVDDKKQFLLRNHIAVWDVIQSCDIVGSSDNSIKNVVPNNIKMILENSTIEHIYVNGKKAEQLYKKYIQVNIEREAICLPSTSPANAMWSFTSLLEAWSKIME